MNGGKKGKLLGYRWSSLPSHARGNEPDWLDTGRLLRAFELAGDGGGMWAYVARLEARAAREGGKIDEKAMKALRVDGISERRPSVTGCWIC